MRTEMSEEGWDHPPNCGTVITDSQAAAELRPATARSLDDPALYINRELSWLAFNDRVLEEALDERNPLLERLKFIAIYGTNLDEFFMIRIAGLKQQIEAEVHKRSDDGQLPEEQLAAVAARLRPSLDVMTSCLDDELLPGALRQPLGENASEDVGRPAGGKSDDETHRPRRVGLRPAPPRRGHKRAGGSRQLQELSAQ